MAKIQIAYDTSGATLYAVVRNADGEVWNGSAFEAYATANLGTYDLPMAEQGTASGYYTADFPAAAAGIYAVSVYEQAGASPAEGDALLTGGAIDWAGAAVVSSVGSGVKLADAVAHGGSAATLYLGGGTVGTPSFLVLNSFGNAVAFESAGGDGDGLMLAGDGAGRGLHATGGMTGDGIFSESMLGFGSGAGFAGSLDAAAVASILAGGDVDGFTLEQALKLILAALAGKLSGAATTAVAIRAADDSKDRITATVTADGDRTAVTLDAAG